MACSIYVYATKRGQRDVLIAHGGRLNDSEVDPRGKVTGPGPAKELEKLVVPFDGADPAEVLLAIDRIEQALPHSKRSLKPYLNDIREACRHGIRVREMRRAARDGGAIGELYEDVRVVVTRG